MIDDKKIEDAAKQHSEESYISSYFQACYKDAFMDGAKWAINEFLKKKEYVSSKNQEVGVDAELPDIDELIKKITSNEFIEKKIKDILG